MKKLLFLLLLTGLFACDTQPLEDALDDFAPVIALDPINTSAVVVITDAATGELVTTDIPTTFGGPVGSQVIDIYSDPLQSVNVEGGILNFGISNDIVPTEDAPAQVTIDLGVNGYLPLSRTLFLTSTGTNEFRVSMIRESNPPSGITINQSTSANSTESDVVVTVNTTETSESGTEDEVGSSLEIPSGSVLLSSSGDPLIGSLSTKAVYYSAEEADAIQALPEQLLSNVADTILTLVAATEMTISDASGRIAAQITSPANKLMEAGVENDGTYILNFVLNGATYRELQQLLRLAFISPTTAERVILYSIPEVSELPNGRVSLRYALNSEVFRSAALVYFSEQPCDNSLTINRNGNEGTLPVRITERGFFRSTDLVAGRNILQLRNITRGTKNVRVTLPFENYEESVDICGTTNPTISLPSPPSTLIDATISVNLSCVDPNERVRVTDIPAATVLYRKSTAAAGTAWRVAQNLRFQYDSSTQALIGGSCQVFQVEQGEDYDIKITYDNNEEQTSVNITGTSVVYNEEIDEDICR